MTRQQLVEGDGASSALRIAEDSVSVRHAARPEHVDAHRTWLSTSGLDQIRTPGSLWKSRLDIFPNLSLLPRVEADLLGLDPVRLRQAADRLAEMELATSGWDPAITATPRWMSKVTPESEQRKLLCIFQDIDGTRRSFDLHARFTPGPGRIHFRLDAATRKLVVAYIGRKIESRE
ncbi:hypothetical protein [Frankia sp. AiPs1]